MSTHTDPTPNNPSWSKAESSLLMRWWESGLLFVLLVLALRIIYLIWLCPYTLIEDEAHYWEWARRPELSYYSKGPGIAWCIRASIALFGTQPWSVRLPAALSSAIGALFVTKLAREMSNARFAGLVAAVIYTAIPAYFVLGTLITIDGPFLACWAMACWAGWRIITKGSLPAWVLLGLAIGLGFLIKYTMILFVPGFLVAWWLTHKHKAPASVHQDTQNTSAWIGLILATCIALLGLLPVLIWNAHHDWITLEHLANHLGFSLAQSSTANAATDTSAQQPSGWHYDPTWTLELLGTQLALGGPAIFLAIFSAVVAWRERQNNPALWRAARYLVWVSLPVLVFYVLVSFVAEPEGNWPIAAYVAAGPLGALGVISAWPELAKRKQGWLKQKKQGPRPRLARIMMWRWTIGVGIAMTIGFARADLLANLPLIGPLVPKGRLMFADVRAADAARLLGQLKEETGLEPFVMAHHYGRTSQLAYYLPGRPTVYCAGAYMNGPKKQYDLWDQTNLANPDVYAALKGRPALLVGGEYERWLPAFERVEKIGQLKGEHKKGRMIYFGYGYRGFPDARPDTSNRPPARQPHPSTP